MADFNAKINLDADNSKALRKIEQVEKAVNKLDNAVNKVQVQVEGARKAEQEMARLYRALERVESAALSKLPRSVQMVVAYLKAASQAAQEFGGRLAFAGAAMGNLQRAKFIPAGLLAAGKEVQTLNKNLLITLDMFQRISREFSNLRSKALPRAGGSQGFTGFAQNQYPALPPGFGAGPPALPPGQRGGALAIPYNPFDGVNSAANAKAFSFDPSTLKGLREGVRYFQDLLEEAAIGSKRFRELENTIAELNNQINKAQLKGQRGGVGLQPTPNSLAALRTQAQAQQAALEQAQLGSKAFDKLARSLDNTNRKIRETEKRIEGRRKTGKDRLGTGLQSAALGGGFPLLFGGPSFSALGGGIGGGLGGLIGQGTGFAAGIIGSALGAAVDSLVQGASDTGKALNKLTADVDQLLSAAGQSGTEFEKNVKALEAAGLSTTALRLATERMASVIGQEGVQAMREFGADSQELGNEFAKAMLQMQAAIAGVINSTGILKALVDQLGRGNLYRQARESNDPQQQQLIRRIDKLGYGGIEGGSGLDAFKERQRLINQVIDRQATLQAEELSITEKESKNLIEQKRNLETAQAALNNALSVRRADDIAKGFANQQEERNRKQTQFDTQRAEILKSQEEAIANVRLRLERQIQDIRLSTIRQENQLLDAQGQSRIKALQVKNALAANETNFNLAGSTSDVREAVQLIQNVEAKLAQDALDAEEKKAKIKRDAALQVLQMELRFERLKDRQCSSDIARINQTAAENIKKLQDRVLEENIKHTAEKYATERQIASLQLAVLSAEQQFEFQKLQDKLNSTGALDDRLKIIDQLNELAIAYNQVGEVLKQLDQGGSLYEPPAALESPAGAPALGVPEISGELLNDQISLQKDITAELLKQVDLTTDLGKARANAQIDKVILAPLKAATDQIEQIQNKDLTPAQRIEKQAESIRTVFIPELEKARQRAIDTGKPIEFWDDAIARANQKLGETDQALKKLETETFRAKLDDLVGTINQELARAMETALVDTIAAAISGADDLNEKLQELASNLLSTIGSILVRAGTNMALGPGGLFGPKGLPGFANGGTIPMGTTAVVGENGPEIVHTRPGGTEVISNEKAFGDAADAMTGTSQAFADSGEAMAMATATRSANSTSAAEASALQTAEEYFATGKSTVSFDTYRVGEMDVVTQADAVKIGMQAAKQAEANVYKGLRNMPAIRTRTGA